jgi:protein-S-isoprenylcysteine O-methyltransferase Ste14
MPAWLYRAAFIALLSALSLLRLAYRLKAGTFRRGLWAPEEPAFFIVARSLLGLPLAAGVAGYCFFPEAIPWTYLRLPDGLRLAGLPLGAGALVLLAFVHAALGVDFSSGPAPRAARLVRTGPYARVRHPMYLAYFLLFTAAFLLSANWVIGAFGLAIIGLLMSFRRVREEALLVQRYGAEYLEYREATGAFLPRLKPRGAASRAPALRDGRPPARRRTRSPRKASARSG